MQLSYIKIFLDCLDCIEPLDDAERGRLFTALLEYAKSGKPPVLQGNERFLFPTLRLQHDREAAAYEKQCEMNRRNGTLGGQAARKRPLASASQDKEEEKDKEKEQDKDSSFCGASRPARTGGPQKQRDKKVSGQRRETLEENQRYFEQMNRYLDQLHQQARAAAEQAQGPTSSSDPPAGR